ncbi:histidine phosphatase family protein [Rummeliibacillus pycnus]|uniref:histidine phosphatase family protein n=1 Tax=Rummeliibacillus pycnus TaxID=101070 RepID=UPI003D2A65E4
MDYAVTVYLIRHARTKSNNEHRYLGWTDEAILPNQNLPAINSKCEMVFGSDLKRCRQTAKFYFLNASYFEDAGFRESNFGEFEGKTYDDLKDISQYQKWIDDPNHFAPPAGETLIDVTNRCIAAFKRLQEGLNKYPIILHGGTIRTLLVQLAPEPSNFWDWHVSHDEMFKLQWSTREAFKEGKRCTSLSVVPITANMNM